MALTRTDSSRFSKGVLLSTLLIASNLALITIVPQIEIRVTITDILYPMAGLVAAAALVQASLASRRISSRHALAWGVIAAGVLCFAFGDVVWGILEAGLHQQPFPSAADGLYLTYYVLFLLGILLLPSQKLSRNEWTKRLLDIGIVMLSASLIFWTFLIGPQVAANQSESAWVGALSLAYPVGDFVLLWALVMLIYRKRKDQPALPIFFLAASATAQIITDSIFSYQSINATYQGGGLLDIGWILAYLCAGLAGILQYESAVTGQDPSIQKKRLSNLFAKSNLLSAHFPYLWLVSAYLLLLGSHYVRFPLDFSVLALGVGGIISLVLVRQVLTINENTVLVAQLNHVLQRVQTQAGELQKTNQALTTEIGERQRIAERLSYAALHDALTDLPNRVFFMDRLRQALQNYLQKEVPFTVLFLDLDYFKVINDSLGHTIGDQLLVMVAQRLKYSLRSRDTVARLGGDEFVILMEGTNQVDAVEATTKRILREISKLCTLETHQVFVSASVGVVLGSKEYTEAEDVLRDADLAMYHTKVRGKNRIEFFKPNMRENAISRLVIENDLRQALEKDEFRLHYQPILSFVTNRAIGFEALIRWQHPMRGLVAPAEFLPIAEESGLIIPIGKWVLQEACRQAKEWQNAHASEELLGINVNISNKQFLQEDFVEIVSATLQETGLAPSCLHLEITENVLIENTEAAITVFDQLNGMGVELHIDDFGTGYSSLNYLRRIPIHTIKIDKSFVQEIDGQARHSDLVKTMILMATTLGVEAIAEGVETEDQLQVLKQLGCKLGQGYLLSRPMEAERASAWINANLT